MKISHTCNNGFLLAIWTFALLCACSAVGVASEPRAFILDRGTNSVIALAPENAAILGTVSFEGGKLKTMIQVPHSKRLAVFDQGPGKETLLFGWHPEGKASMSFVDMGSMKITSSLQLGWGIGQVQSAIGARITVTFEHAGKRLIDAAAVTLVPVEDDRRPSRRPDCRSLGT